MTTALRSDTFVDAAELAALIAGDSPPVLLDIRFDPNAASLRPEYEQGHLPGAHFVDLQTELAGPGGGTAGRRPLPDAELLQRSIRRWGISDGTPVVVYDNNAGLTAGRAWWVLRWAGVRDVRLLDGGFAAWTAVGGTTTLEEPPASTGTFDVTPGQLPTIDADDAAALATRGVLLDARGRKAFAGGAPGEGHIPGAVEAGTRANLDTDGLLLPESELRERFAALGVLDADAVGAYCGGGVAAAHEVLVLASLGVEASLFVGSWSAWAADPARPVATGLESA